MNTAMDNFSSETEDDSDLSTHIMLYKLTKSQMFSSFGVIN